MRLRHMRNDADNAHMCGNIRDYLRVCGYAHRFALMRIGEFWRMAIPTLDPNPWVVTKNGNKIMSLE